MDFELEETQKMLKQLARDFLIAECPTSLVRLAETDRSAMSGLYEKMAAMGWHGLILPAKFGGDGGSFLDLVVLLEEMGRACLPGPFFSSSVLGAISLLESGDQANQARFLPELAKGKVTLTLALTEATGEYTPASIQMRAVRSGGNYILNGTKNFVPDIDVVDYIICACRTGDGDRDVTCFLVDARSKTIESMPLVTMAGDAQFEVTFRDTPVPEAMVLGGINQGWTLLEKALQKATVAKCAEMVGGAQRVLEISVEHAKNRVQFGRPIGSFQAIQHHCSDMLMDVEAARFATYLAGWKLDEGLPCGFEVSAAKAWVSEACERVSLTGQRIHAAVGFMLDHDLTLYFRRAKQAESVLGDSDFHRERVAQELGM